MPAKTQGVEPLTVTVKPPTLEGETPPTCEQEGSLSYTAEVTYHGRTFTDEKEVILTAKGHVWESDGKAEWSTDNAQATFHFRCLREGCTQAASVTVNTTSTVTLEPTCTEEGLRVYTAVGQMGNATVEETKSVPIPALGHDFKDGKCSRCGAKDPNYKAAAAADTVPDTGDSTVLLPWITLLLACAGALTEVLHRRARQTDRK